MKPVAVSMFCNGFFELMLLMILREPSVLKVDNIGVLRAQRDPILRRAFDAIHARPGRHWTLASLANCAGVSRSAFALRFKQLTEVSAMHYLRRYRVALAERRIREEKHFGRTGGARDRIPQRSRIPARSAPALMRTGSSGRSEMTSHPSSMHPSVPPHRTW
jgi:AraC-like DNA-binding protein